MNAELTHLENTFISQTDCQQSTELATHMLVFMVRALIKPSITIPVAQFPTSNLTGKKLFPMVMDTIEGMELSDLHVISVMEPVLTVVSIRYVEEKVLRHQILIDPHMIYICFVMYLIS